MMRRRIGSISQVVKVDSDIRNSTIACWLSVVLFGFASLVNTISLLTSFSVFGACICFILWFVLIQSIMQLNVLKKVKEQFALNPEKVKRSMVPKPILFHLVFWVID